MTTLPYDAYISLIGDVECAVDGDVSDDDGTSNAYFKVGRVTIADRTVSAHLQRRSVDDLTAILAEVLAALVAKQVNDDSRAGSRWLLAEAKRIQGWGESDPDARHEFQRDMEPAE
jgi:hypothetical protein